MQDVPLLRLNLHQVQAFLSVAELGSFRNAATQLARSQSAVSTQVRQLEHSLGVQLLHRTTRSVRLSPAGLRLQDASRSALVGLARVAADLRAEAALEHGSLTIACVPSVASSIAPELVSRFREKHPAIQLRMLDVDSQRAIALLVGGEADVGLLPQAGYSFRCEFIPLAWDECMLIVPVGHALATRRRAALKEVARHPLVMVPPEVLLRQTYDEAFARASLKVTPVQEVYGALATLAFVRHGFGIAFLPALSLTGLNMTDVAIVPLKEKVGRMIGIVTPVERARSAAVIAFNAFAARYSARAQRGQA